jgi:PAS domain S-box-containing protein
VNNAFIRMMGLKAEDVIGKTMKELFPSSKDQGLLDLYGGVIETGESVHTEMCYQGEGLNNWYDLIAVKKGEDEAVITFTDITEQKRATLEIERQRILLDNILKFSPTGISVTEVVRDKEGNVVDGRTLIANEAAERFTGIPNHLYLSKTISEIDPNILSSPLHQLSMNTLKTGHPFQTQYLFEPTGRWLELSVARMDDDHLINVFMDITGTKESQLQQEKLMQELERTNASLQEFAYAASHDLKEPVRKIILFSERLKHRLTSCMSEEDFRLFGRMENSAERMGLLVDDLLQYSQVSQQTSLYEEIDLNDKVRLVLEDLEVLIEEKQAKIFVGPLPKIKGHRRQLQQLFQNLISNALKYSKPGIPPEINITSSSTIGRASGFDLPADEKDQKFYQIEVSDNGIGFAQEDAERIFNMFQRLHGKAEYAGTGIGLAIVRKVVQNHHGYIAAQSEPDKGATFKVLLPTGR